MKKTILRFILISIVMTALIFFANSRMSARAEASHKWINSSINPQEYTNMYIYNIDVRDIKIKIFDEEEEEYDEEPLYSGTLEKVANDLYLRFVRRLKRIMPVDNVQEIDKSQKSLVINIKLAATFEFEDPGLIKALLFGDQYNATDISIVCEILDSQSSEQLFLFTDTRPLTMQLTDTPLAQEEDMDALGYILNVWARELSDNIELQIEESQNTVQR